MALTAGDRLGPYEILEPLGAGGMGEVYEARDTRLDRTVAIKVLPSDHADDGRLKERFEREARAVSSLNHTHICALYDVGEHEGSPYIVMELVDGETLESRLAKGRLPQDQGLAYAIQIADALSGAHRHNIVHRDLKPGNIMLTSSGVKLLDFGLAKLRDGAAASPLSQLPTQNAPLTAEGTILGTLQYMSPEQLEGKDADARADIFAFGAVVYEMLTGKKAFEGKSQASLIAAIMGSEPPSLAELDVMIPRSLDHLVRRCLAKDPDQRWQSATDLSAELTWISESEAPAAQEVASPRAAWTRVAAAAAGALAVGVLGTALALRDTSPPPTAEVTKLVMDLPEGWVLRSGSGHLGRSARQALALSPDGRHLVFAATDGERAQLFLRPMERERAVPIPGTEGSLEEDAPRSPFFSPDGQSIGFFAGDQLRRVPLAGGEVRTITVSGADFSADFFPYWASWAEDDTILLVGRAGLRRLPAQGGTAGPLTNVEGLGGLGGSSHLFPEMLPGGDAVLFNVTRGEIPSAWDIVAQSVDTGDRHVLVEGGSDPRYVASGHIVFARSGTLMAAPFDLARLQVTGDPVVVVEDVMHTERGPSSFTRRGDGQFTVSRSGTLAYVPGGVYPVDQNLLGWMDRQGRFEALPLPPARRMYARVSPDGTRLAYAQGPTGERQVWVYDIGLEVPMRLTSRGDNTAPVWSPDGTRIVFASDGGDGSPWNIFSMAADGRGEPERLTEAARIQFPSSWSPDGVLAFLELAETGPDLMILPMEGEAKPEPFLQTPFHETYPAFSPDGRWLAYSSNQTGRHEVYVRPFPAGEPEYRVSTDGGRAPLWSPDGRQLFYRTRENEETIFKVVDVTADESFTRSQPRLLLSKAGGGTVPTRSYDIAPDGRRFVMGVPSEEEPESLRMTRINVILNWHEELRRLAPAGAQ